MASYLCRMLKTVLHEAIMAGGEQVSKYFNQTFEIKYKEGRNNLVTAADHASEKAILEVIQKAYPDHYILTEETGSFLKTPIINGSLILLTVRSILPMAFPLIAYLLV
ncbi:inositol monophosphatase family protein [Niabella hibiscisoli]|uniref:inositol monophosphatase family protein n=1 Tax=Niabella hibiscisoli TaxID=1825928 RepID=UPI00293E4784|nr:inositol monophosphatase family protein [Niabella hibiscisoli]